MDWKDYWNTSAQVLSRDPLRQVGKTVDGKPISPEQLATIGAEVRRQLALLPTDRVLDLGCGNGLVTEQVAPHCAAMVAVDFSAPLIETARLKGHAGVEYVLGDICDLPATVRHARFDKVYLYEVMQHLEPEQAVRLFAGIAALPHVPQRLLLASVPDASRLWNFYDTLERRADYETRRRDGTEAIGHWWDLAALAGLLDAHGFDASVIPQDPSLHGAHYRVDVIAVPTGTRGGRS